MNDTQGNMIGQRVGNYRVTGKLGEGGMGAVFVAEHQLIGRKAAIKVLHPAVSTNPSIVQRFFNEARATSAIRHPGIVDVFDFGHLPDGRAYIAMELLDGESLAAHLRKRGRLDLAEIAAIGRQAASALSATHEQGIVHRDLKPDNIQLVPDADAPGGTRVKILDFGIAKLAPGGGDGAGLKTHTGAVMGTPVYMSPEQCRSAGEVDFRSDIYSLGCVLYEMACGQPPFVREGMGEVLAAHIYEEPTPPRSLDPTIAPALEALLLRALVKQPAARTPSMAQLRFELEAAAGMRPGAPEVFAAAPSATTAEAETVYAGAPAPRSTTLGGATGQSMVRRPRSFARAATLVSLVGAGALGAVGFALLRPTTPTSAIVRPAEVQVTTPVGTPPPLVEKPAPVTVELRIGSDPAGADVIDANDGRILGRSPMVKTVPRGEGEAHFTVRLAGYEDAGLSLDTRTDGSGQVALRPRPPALAKPTRKASSDPAADAAPTARPAAKAFSKNASKKNASKKNDKAPDVGLFDN